MPSTAEKLLVRLREQDGPLGVTRDTLRNVKVLPRYERDGGLLTAAQLRDARSLVSQAREPTSSLFGTTARQRARKAGKKARP